MVSASYSTVIALIQYYTASWVGQGSVVRVSASYSTVIALIQYYTASWVG